MYSLIHLFDCVGMEGDFAVDQVRGDGGGGGEPVVKAARLDAQPQGVARAEVRENMPPIFLPCFGGIGPFMEAVVQAFCAPYRTVPILSSTQLES